MALPRAVLASDQFFAWQQRQMTQAAILRAMRLGTRHGVGVRIPGKPRRASP